MAAILAWTRASFGAPQANLGATVGVAVTDVAGPRAASAAFHLGARGDVLFLRERGRDMAVGPYVDVATAGFGDVDVGGGAEWLLPVRDDVPAVLSAGAFWRDGGGYAWAPGLETTVFLGSRSYNFHSLYEIAAGLFAQGRWVARTPGTFDCVFGVQVDGELLMLPALWLVQLVKGS